MKIKALHVASFDGNVGDIGQIMGFRQHYHYINLICLRILHIGIAMFIYIQTRLLNDWLKKQDSR